VTFRVLFVCTGNVCRSPAAELLFQALADPRADIAAHSAGTHALVGDPIDDSTAAVLRQVGLDPSRHRGTQVTPAMATQADLVLTASREHRDLLLTEAPTILRRTFTMKEFARLVHSIPNGMGLREAVEAAHLRRPHVGRVPGSEDDISDPYRQEVGVARVAVDQIGTALATAMHLLGVIRQPSPSGAAGA
jgi:protein-tyrosine phosphatase